jgi:hypothetical protein
MASQTLNTAVVAPHPSAMVTMAVTAKPGDLRSTRAAKHRSFQKIIAKHGCTGGAIASY